MLFCALVGGLIATAALMRAARRHGKRRTIVIALFVEGVAYLVLAMIPARAYADHRGLLLIVGFVIGSGQAIAFALPESMLADIVDYDELHTGERSEGMYAVIDTNLQQFTDIGAGVIPMLALGVAGYVPLNGCACGCGVSCAKAVGMPYARWHCPSHVAYTCTGAPDSRLLFGDADLGDYLGDNLGGSTPAVAPCAEQPRLVSELILFCMLVLPGALALVATLPAARLPITARVHAMISATLAKRHAASDAPSHSDGHSAQRLADVDAGAELDPLTGHRVALPSNSATEHFRDHFSASEWARSRGAVGGLRAIVGVRLGVWACAVIALVAAMAASADESVVTIGCLGMSVLLVLIPWDVLRLRAALRPPPADTATARAAAGVSAVAHTSAPRAEAEPAVLEMRAM